MGEVLGEVTGDLFSYNKEGFKFERDLSQKVAYTKQKSRIRQIDLYREDLKDLFGLTSGKMDNYLIVNTLNLGFCLEMYYKGRLPLLTPSWLFWAWAINLSGSIVCLMLSSWFSLYASVMSQVYYSRSVTCWLRLPIPSYSEIIGSSNLLEDYEKEGINKILRVPVLFAETKQVTTMNNAKDDAPPNAANQQETTHMPNLRDENITSVEIGCDVRMITERKWTSFRGHFALFRKLQSRWILYESFSRICMYLAVHQLIQALGYYSLAYYTLFFETPLAGWTACFIFLVGSYIYTRMHVVVPKNRDTIMIIFFSASPAIIFSVASLVYFTIPVPLLLQDSIDTNRAHGIHLRFVYLENFMVPKLLAISGLFCCIAWQLAVFWITKLDPKTGIAKYMTSSWYIGSMGIRHLDELGLIHDQFTHVTDLFTRIRGEDFTDELESLDDSINCGIENLWSRIRRSSPFHTDLEKIHSAHRFLNSVLHDAVYLYEEKNIEESIEEDYPRTPDSRRSAYHTNLMSVRSLRHKLANGNTALSELYSINPVTGNIMMKSANANDELEGRLPIQEIAEMLYLLDRYKNKILQFISSVTDEKQRFIKSTNHDLDSNKAERYQDNIPKTIFDISQTATLVAWIAAFFHTALSTSIIDTTNEYNRNALVDNSEGIRWLATVDYPLCKPMDRFPNLYNHSGHIVTHLNNISIHKTMECLYSWNPGSLHYTTPVYGFSPLYIRRSDKGLVLLDGLRYSFIGEQNKVETVRSSGAPVYIASHPRRFAREYEEIQIVSNKVIQMTSGRQVTLHGLDTEVNTTRDDLPFISAPRLYVECIFDDKSSPLGLSEVGDCLPSDLTQNCKLFVIHENGNVYMCTRDIHGKDGITKKLIASISINIGYSRTKETGMRFLDLAIILENTICILVYSNVNHQYTITETSPSFDQRYVYCYLVDTHTLEVDIRRVSIDASDVASPNVYSIISIEGAHGLGYSLNDGHPYIFNISFQ